MTAEHLRNAHQTSPFEPFTIRIADGRKFQVAHPDFLSQSPTGRTVIVYGSGENFSILDLLLIRELEIEPPKATADGAAA
ncbi:MAG TPA: hypothetical protein VL992_19920 [Tepidisphaeraceae bacterium]|nr:hypothetical protein [Tepidisphaeraceae bacterium]